MKKLIFALFLLIVSCNADTDFLKEVVIEPEILPSQVELIFPENNSECTTGTVVNGTESEVVFDWSDAQLGDSYRVTLINLFTGEEQTFDSENSTLPIRLLRSTPYSWKVTTLNRGSSESADSNTESFYNSGPGIQFYIPFPATNPSPGFASKLPSSTSTVDFSWDGADLDNDVRAFDFYFGENKNPPLVEAGLGTNSYTNVAVGSGKSYYWKIITRDAVGNQSHSDVFFFSIN